MKNPTYTFDEFCDHLAAMDIVRNYRHITLGNGENVELDGTPNFESMTLRTMDYMRQSIHLRGYAQKGAKQEYKREAFALFTEMLENIKRDTIAMSTRVQFRSESDINAIDQQRREHEPQNLQFTHADASLVTSPEPSPNPGAVVAMPVTRQEAKIGRNDACPCGSGKKYKTCHTMRLILNVMFIDKPGKVVGHSRETMYGSVRRLPMVPLIGNVHMKLICNASSNGNPVITLTKKAV